MALYLWKKLDDKYRNAQDILGPDIIKGQTIINPSSLLCDGRIVLIYHLYGTDK